MEENVSEVMGRDGQESSFAMDGDMNDREIQVRKRNILRPKVVKCDSGLEIECDILFWVTQASAAPWLQKAGLVTDGRGFILSLIHI